MTVISRTLRELRPDPSELLPLGERFRYVEALRAAVATLVVAAVLVRPGMSEVGARGVVLASVVYLGASLVPQLLRGVDPSRILPFLKGLLLIDGIYLTWMTAVTGAGASPLRWLFFLEILLVTLLVSYRTGLKFTAWCSLLFLVVVAGSDRGIWDGGTPKAAGVFAAGLLVVGAMWVVALATATFSAIADRELRRQKVHLGDLANLSKQLDEVDPAAAIPPVLLRTVCDTFGFARGLVLASPQGDLRLMATFGVEGSAVEPGLDPLMERAWARREPQPVRRIDPAVDPRLAGLLPDAVNLMVVPMFLNGGYRLGILALDHPADRRGLRRWESSMLAQFAAQAALALHNAWLREDAASKLEDIRLLQRELVANNARLELAVADRTEELRGVIHDLEEIDEQRGRLLSHVVGAQEDERQRIANDIHDDPLQKLVAMKMHLELLRRVDDRAELDEILELARKCIKSLRFLLFDLRPPILDEQGLGPAIERFLAHWDTGVASTVHDELLVEVPVEARVILYRIAQEALANVRKHAEARNVDVEFTWTDGGVLMRIEDDGVGCTPEHALRSRNGHLGLVAMRERAEMAGGRCDLHSLPGEGTTLEVWLPCHEGTGAGESGTGDDGTLVLIQGHRSA